MPTIAACLVVPVRLALNSSGVQSVYSFTPANHDASGSAFCLYSQCCDVMHHRSEVGGYCRMRDRWWMKVASAADRWAASLYLHTTCTRPDQVLYGLALGRRGETSGGGEEGNGGRRAAGMMIFGREVRTSC